MTPQDLFLDDLKDVYNAESQASKLLPKQAKAASSQELKDAFQGHLAQTRNQIDRLKSVFELLGKRAQGKPCKGMQGIAEEAQEKLQEGGKGPLMDFALVCAALKVEHYEVASYTGLVAAAKALGHTEAADHLSATLKEEQEAARRLSAMIKPLLKEMSRLGKAA